MDSIHNTKNVFLCNLCKTAVPALHCVICQIHICTTCVGEHLSDESKEHNVVPLKMKGSTVLCKEHSTKICELHCKQCDSPICALCVSSDKHEKHKKIEIWKEIENKKIDLHNDLQEMEQSILPRYKAFALDISNQKANIKKNSKKLKLDIDTHGEEWHKQINTIIEKYKSDIDEIKSTNNTVLNKQRYEITYRILEIKQRISDHKRLLDSFDFCSVSEYKSRNAEFRTLPSQPKRYLPSFTPYQINKSYIQQQFGLLTTLPIINKEESDVSCTPPRPFIDEPQIITDLKAEFWEENELKMICCLTDEKIWTCGEENLIRLYDLKGELAFEIPTNSGHSPQGITMATSDGCRFLVYIDCFDRTLNIMKSNYVQEITRLGGWCPISICGTSVDAFLVIMVSDYGQTNIARFFGNTVLQTIDITDSCPAFYSFDGSEPSCKFICENRNFDICVSNCDNEVVLVFDHAGKIRFQYNGNPSPKHKEFWPKGITTDSQSRILIADCYIQSIHILDQDGQFLRFISISDFKSPYGVCVDTRDNLFVAERGTGVVKKIQYYK